MPSAEAVCPTPPPPPLSHRERVALQRILSATSDPTLVLGPDQQAAIDGYVAALSTPPLIPQEILRSARVLIQVWAKFRTQGWSRRIPCILLELDPTASTEPLSPLAVQELRWLS